MPWTYVQSTGALTRDDAHVSTGYSGLGEHKNRPESEILEDLGPIPRGTYAIGKMQADGRHMGPNVLPLRPDPGNDMHGRHSFFIHGDNKDHTASTGCIILGPAIRRQIADSGDQVLIVVA